MATPAQMDRLVGRALFNDEFRELLLTDPEKAARTLRYKLTDAQLARIRRLNREELEKLSTAFADAVDLYQHQGLGFW